MLRSANQPSLLSRKHKGLRPTADKISLANRQPENKKRCKCSAKSWEHSPSVLSAKAKPRLAARPGGRAGSNFELHRCGTAPGFHRSSLRALLFFFCDHSVQGIRRNVKENRHERHGVLKVNFPMPSFRVTFCGRWQQIFITPPIQFFLHIA